MSRKRTRRRGRRPAGSHPDSLGGRARTRQGHREGNAVSHTVTLCVMTAYFGTGWPAGLPILDGAHHLDPPPHGTVCLNCTEPFEADDQGFYTPYIGDEMEPQYVARPGVVAYHRECMQMDVVGHMIGVCSCTGYDRSRASAREAARRWEARNEV